MGYDKDSYYLFHFVVQLNKKPDVLWRASSDKHRGIRPKLPVSNARHPAILSEAELTANTRSHSESYINDDKHTTSLQSPVWNNHRRTPPVCWASVA